MRQLILFSLLFLLHQTSIAQNTQYTREVIDTLCSKDFAGRGYTQNGHLKAANYIQNEFKKMGIKPYPGTNYFQQFNFSINTFPDSVSVQLDGHSITPGKDYLIAPHSGSAKGSFDCIQIKKSKYLNPKKFIKHVVKETYKGKFLIIDEENFISDKEKNGIKACIEILEQYQGFQLAGVAILTRHKLTWSQSPVVNSIAFIQILSDSIPSTTFSKITVNIKNDLLKNIETQNVTAFIRGKKQTDSVILITGHYDHLGQLGSETYFPGANDNASGISMILNLAKHYADLNYTPNHSILFIAFGAEEIGLIGSKFYTQNPYFPLEQIKFVINLDLLGTGDDGIMAVNGKLHKHQFEWLTEVNEEYALLPIIKKRGKAANSDHYFFTEKQVPAFFLYTMGGIQAYHDIYDIPKTLPLTKYKEVFQLITNFIIEIENHPKVY